MDIFCISYTCKWKWIFLCKGCYCPVAEFYFIFLVQDLTNLCTQFNSEGLKSEKRLLNYLDWPLWERMGPGDFSIALETRGLQGLGFIFLAKTKVLHLGTLPMLIQFGNSMRLHIAHFWAESLGLLQEDWHAHLALNGLWYHVKNSTSIPHAHTPGMFKTKHS